MITKPAPKPGEQKKRKADNFTLQLLTRKNWDKFRKQVFKGSGDAA